MTQTQSPSRTGSPLRVAALIALCAATLLFLGWAIFSPLGGTGQHEAQAQAQPSGAGGSSGGEEPAGEEGAMSKEELREVYGPSGNKPFGLPAGLEIHQDDAENGNGGDNGAEGGSDPPVQPVGNETEDQNGAQPAGNGGELPAPDNGEDLDTQQQNIQGSTPAGPGYTPPANGGSAAGSGTDDVNCQNPEDDFEELLCEEGAGGSTNDRTGSAPPGGVDHDWDGGSGRSGAGEPTDTFRNGGPAPGK